MSFKVEKDLLDAVVKTTYVPTTCLDEKLDIWDTQKQLEVIGFVPANISHRALDAAK